MTSCYVFWTDWKISIQIIIWWMFYELQRVEVTNFPIFSNKKYEKPGTEFKAVIWRNSSFLAQYGKQTQTYNESKTTDLENYRLTAREYSHYSSSLRWTLRSRSNCKNMRRNYVKLHEIIFYQCEVYAQHSAFDSAFDSAVDSAFDSNKQSNCTPTWTYHHVHQLFLISI